MTKSTKTQIPSTLIQSLSFEESNKQLEALKEHLFTIPIINETKVQIIKEEIAASRYQIDSHKIAAKLVEDMVAQPCEISEEA